MKESKRLDAGVKTLSLLHCSALGGWLSHINGQPIGSTRRKFLGILQLCRNDAELSLLSPEDTSGQSSSTKSPQRCSHSH